MQCINMIQRDICSQAKKKLY